MRRQSFVRVLILGSCLASPATFAAAAAADATTVTAVPPAAPAASTLQRRPAPIERLLPTGAPRHAVALPAASAAERATLKGVNAARPAVAAKGAVRTGKGVPLAIGFGRNVAAPLGALDGAALPWIELPDGGFAARVEVTSGGAAALRLGLVTGVTDPDVSVRFNGSAAGAPVFGPFPGNALAEAAQRQGVFWSPVLEGDTATIEIYRPADVAAGALQFRLLRVSHLVVAGEGLRRLSPKDASDIGSSQSCEIDVACVASSWQPLRDAASAVAKMVFTAADGGSYACTGTLLADSLATNTPYLYTAAHCIDSAVAAQTLNTYWFFDAQACGVAQVPPYVLLAGGAMLLGRSDDWDWALVRLNEAPPTGVLFSAWRAEPVPGFADGTGIHHPNGDLKKWSQGIALGYEYLADGTGASFIRMRWSQGATEEGSSGSALFTFNGAGGYYELRGGLFGGDSSCRTRAELDYFSRLDQALPYLRQYLTPNAASPRGVVPVVEFYNKEIRHYFVSADPFEINNLDTGAEPGWERTGLRFLAYAEPSSAPAGTMPVCRFYLPPPTGNTHFYSGDPAECAMVRTGAVGPWIYEGPDVFYIEVANPVTGACPVGTRPVWRFFNTRTINHRYTAEVLVRDQLRTTPGWVGEGYGPDFVYFCAPER